MLRDILVASINHPNLFFKDISPSIFVFEEKVQLLCFNCRKYGINWTCPPNIPEIDYTKLFNSYSNALLVYYYKDDISQRDYETIRNDSTNILHKQLLDMEKICWDNNVATSVSFIGGSCKLCKDGCSKDRCRSPHLSRIPLEATGINVVASLANVGIDIVFPTNSHLGRYGVLLY